MATVHTLLKKVLFVVQLIYFVLGTQAVFFDRQFSEALFWGHYCVVNKKKVTLQTQWLVTVYKYYKARYNVNYLYELVKQPITYNLWKTNIICRYIDFY